MGYRKQNTFSGLMRCGQMKGFTRQHIKTGKEKGHREPHEKRLRMNKE